MSSLKNILTKPVKRYTDGGELEWGRIGRKLSGAYNATPAYNTSAPTSTVDAGFNQSFEPLSGGITTDKPSSVSPTGIGSGLAQASTSLKTAFSSIAPFASNIVNALRTPPMPRLPTTDNLVTLHTPSYENEKNEVSRQINADSELAGRNVDGQTAARIRLFNTGQKLDRLSGINERESNARIGVGNEQARINAGIMSSNNRKMDQYNDSLTERDIANQREKSANLANFSDKVVGIQNEAEKRRVDLEKTKTLAHLFDNSGVANRQRKVMKDAGQPDPLGMDYSDLEKKVNGGMMRRSFYRSINSRAQTLKSLYKAPN